MTLLSHYPRVTLPVTLIEIPQSREEAIRTGESLPPGRRVALSAAATLTVGFQSAAFFQPPDTSSVFLLQAFF